MVDDRGLPGEIVHTFLREGRPDEVCGKTFYGPLLRGMDPFGSEDVEPGMSPALHHTDELPGDFPFIATFGVLLRLLHAKADLFRTGWFVESVISASLVVLVIRTKRPFFRSLPGRSLLAATLAIVAVTLVLPFTPLGKLFGFVPLPGTFLVLMGGIVALYILSAEILKRVFYRKAR